MEKEKKTIKITLKTAILLSLLFISILTIVAFYFCRNTINKKVTMETSNQNFEIIKVNLINKSIGNEYNWKNDSANMLIETVEIKDFNNNKLSYNIVFFSTEFFENFFEDSFYDERNQKFYFYGKDRDTFVQGNDNKYYDENSEFSLVQNLNISTKVIDKKLYIPIPLYRNNFAYQHSLGFDKETNTIYYYGPRRSVSANQLFPNIDNVELIEKINKTTFYYNPDKYEKDNDYCTLEHMIDLKEGEYEYYVVNINGESQIIKMYYKYNGMKHSAENYTYDRYSVIAKKIDGNVIRKVDSNGKFFIIEKNNKFGVIDANNNIILDTIYDDIEGYENTKNYFYMDNAITYYGSDDSYRNNLQGIIIKLKKNNKYTLYSLDINANILNEQWYKNINFKSEITTDTNLKNASKTLKMSCIYTDNGMGMVIDNNLYLNPVYDKIEIIEFPRYMNKNNKLIFKLYKDNSIYIVASDGNYNNFKKISDKYYITKKGYKDIEVSTEWNDLSEEYFIIDNEERKEILRGRTGGVIDY